MDISGDTHPVPEIETNAGAPHQAACHDLAALLAMSLVAPQEPSVELQENILRDLTAVRPAVTARPGSADVGPHSPGLKFLFNAPQAAWTKLDAPGAWLKPLSIEVIRDYAVTLGQLEPGAKFPEHQLAHGRELYLLMGDLLVGTQRLGPGDFHHAAAGTDQSLYSPTGCVFLIVLSTADLQAHMV